MRKTSTSPLTFGAGGWRASAGATGKLCRILPLHLEKEYPLRKRKEGVFAPQTACLNAWPNRQLYPKAG